MADLQNILPHRANTSVTVNGNRYEIDGDGVARDVAPEDAEELLQGKSWKPYVAREPVSEPKSGKSEPPPAEDPPQADVAPEEDPPAEDPEGEEPEGEGEEWPDPTESMSKAYLQQMADAYSVEYTDRTTKKTLVKLIKEAMYE